MNQRRPLVRPSLVLAAIALVLGGCSGEDASNDTTAAPTAQETPTTPAAADDDLERDSEPTAVDPTPEIEPTPTTEPAAEPVETGVPFMESWGLPDIVQLTPVTGAGQRPLFEWEPVSGAAGYSLFVYTPDGTPYWSWAGTDTSTYLGGAVRLDDDKPGPRIIDGMSWVVSALDTSSQRIAVSEQRWVSP